MQLTDSNTGRLQGQNSLDLMTGETPDISEYLDFGWYDIVWFKEDTGLRETQIRCYRIQGYSMEQEFCMTILD